MQPHRPTSLRLFEVIGVAVSNVLTLALLTLANRPGPTPLAELLRVLGCSTVSSAALVVGAVGLYRLLGRNLPRQQPRAARRVALLSTVALLASVIAAAGIGQASALVAGLAALGVVSYAAFARFLPAVGVVSLGLIAGAAMLVASPRQGPVWPVMLTMTHVMGAAAMRLYLRHRRPAWTGRDTLAAVAGWSFWAMVWLGVSQWRGGVATASTLGLALALAVAVALVLAAVVGRAAIFRSPWAARAMHAYNIAWLLGSPTPLWAALPLALALVSPLLDRWLTRPATPAFTEYAATR